VQGSEAPWRAGLPKAQIVTIHLSAKVQMVRLSRLLLQKVFIVFSS
jgi:hypothetical protein